MAAGVLLTGGAGFIGSFLADHFLAAGRRVRLLDVMDPQVHPQGRPVYLDPEVDLQVADVRDRAAVGRALDGVDTIVHCAAAVGVGQSLYRVQHYVETNAGGMASLLEACLERRADLRRLVVLTSMTGYGEGLYRRPSDGAVLRVDIRSEEAIRRFGWEPVDPRTHEVLEPVPTPEDAALLARNVYALSKRWQEELSLALGATYGFPVVCLRLFNVYGPRQSLSNPYTGVLAIFLARLLAGQHPVVYEDGGQTRDFVSVHDVVRAVQAVIDEPHATGRVYNVGTGVGRSIADIARTLARLLGRGDLAPEVNGQFRKGDVRHCTADAGRIRSEVGFAPRADWEDTLAEIIEWSRTAPASDRFDQAAAELKARGLVA